MKNLQPNDILINKDKNEIKVIAAFNQQVWTTVANNFEDADYRLDTIDSLISNGWSKKETPWVPTVGEEYCFLAGDGKECWSTWDNDGDDQARAAFLGVYPDQASAIKAREEVKAWRKSK